LYERGGKAGTREGGRRGGRVKVKDSVSGDTVIYKTFLEKMTRKEENF
jgi:hypothetical protein